MEEMKGEKAIEDFRNKIAIKVVITMREKDTKLKNKMTEIGNVYVPIVVCTCPYLEMRMPLYSYSSCRKRNNSKWS